MVVYRQVFGSIIGVEFVMVYHIIITAQFIFKVLPEMQSFETMAYDRHCKSHFRYNVKVFGLQLQSQQPKFSTILYYNKNRKENTQS